ncbi:rhodanese-related sulfurtransferase [Piscinibacter sakaiensis]|uniref:Rhodanese-related sulfurtransferase n=2 Tax=Piscinibacter sakaiensis TaxID=1547922 RepID=A0A0K8NXC3_PISS1|nr:rhodanese-related sulfurtransferase [Piscinibacter sakaiensis]
MREIDVTELQAFVAAERAAGRTPLLLDVREPWEVALGRIELAGAQSQAWPMHTLPARQGELDPAQPVVCICHHGQRSAQVVAFLSHHGHPAAYNLAGGTDAWSREVDPALPRY